MTLRFAWWGSDTRHQATREIIDTFEDQNPGISVEAEFGDWSGYWDQLATQAAGGNAPDIIQMDEMYVREYADRGALLDLEGVDTSQFEGAAIDAGRTEDGLYAISLGVVALGTVVNADLLEEAGLDLPDDTEWTWEEFKELSSEVDGALDDVFGAGGPIAPPMGLQVWLRQQGEELFTDEGELSLAEEQVEQYFDFLLELRDEASFPSADYMAEAQGLGPEDGPIGTNEDTVGFTWATQLESMANASASDLQLLRLPSFTGDAADNGAWIKGSMFLSASAGTDHPEEAQQFIDFFVNSQDAGEINGMERGLPANLEVREAVLADVDGPQVQAAEYVNAVEQEVEGASPVPPSGFGAFADIIDRYQMELYFERMSVEEAAAGVVRELEEAVD